MKKEGFAYKYWIFEGKIAILSLVGSKKLIAFLFFKNVTEVTDHLTHDEKNLQSCHKDEFLDFSYSNYISDIFLWKQ